MQYIVKLNFTKKISREVNKNKDYYVNFGLNRNLHLQENCEDSFYGDDCDNDENCDDYDDYDDDENAMLFDTEIEAIFASNETMISLDPIHFKDDIEFNFKLLKQHYSELIKFIEEFETYFYTIISNIEIKTKNGKNKNVN